MKFGLEEGAYKGWFIGLFILIIATTWLLAWLCTSATTNLSVHIENKAPDRLAPIMPA